MKHTGKGLCFLSVMTVLLLLVPFSRNEVKAAETLNLKYGTMTKTSFLGVDLTGKTESDARALYEETYETFLEQGLRAVNAEGDEEWVCPLKDVGVKVDKKKLDEDFEDAVLTGSLLSRYKKAKDHAAADLPIRPACTYDEAKITEAVKKAVSEWNGDPVESTATCRSGELEIEVGRNGHEYHYEEGVKAFIEALKTGDLPAEGFEVPLEYTTVEAILSPERVAEFTVIGTCTTEYAKPYDKISTNREQNLRRSTENMCGRVFAPGEEISALDLYGAVTAANGYKEAGTYTTAGHEDQIGGGICQTTSTLYNAVLMAELEVTFRRNHSYLIDYLSPSQDAMVYAQGKQDFKFRNSSSDYLLIDAYIDEEEHSLTVNLIGHEDHPETHSVRYESEVLEKNFPTMIRIESTDNLVLGWGDQDMKVEAVNGGGYQPSCKSRLWKITTDDGIETRTIVGGIDSYKAMNPTFLMAPDVDLKPHWVNDGVRVLYDLCFVDEEETMLGHYAVSAGWPEEQLVAFNEEMTAIMAEKGYEWPDRGTQLSFTSSDGTVTVFREDTTGAMNEPTEDPTEDPSESESEGGE